MNKIYYSIVSILILIIFFLSKSIFFGDNNYSYRSNLINENNKQKSKNKDLKKQNGDSGFFNSIGKFIIK